MSGVSWELRVCGCWGGGTYELVGSEGAGTAVGSIVSTVTELVIVGEILSPG